MEQINSYTKNLENRLTERSDILEEIHLDAAIDAQIAIVGGEGSHSKPIFSENINNDSSVSLESSSESKNKTCPPSKKSPNQPTNQNDELIFDDYCNPNSVSNCLSPYVPSSWERIQAFVDLCHLNQYNNDKEGDILLDIGCGDGRVCIAAAKLTGT